MSQASLGELWGVTLRRTWKELTRGRLTPARVMQSMLLPAVLGLPFPARKQMYSIVPPPEIQTHVSPTIKAAILGLRRGRDAGREPPLEFKCHSFPSRCPRVRPPTARPAASSTATHELKMAAGPCTGSNPLLTSAP